MKTISEILEKFQVDMEAALPALLIAAGVTDFDEYVIGPSRDPENKTMCVYVDAFSKDAERNTLSMIFQAQLYQVDFTSSSKYAQVISDYLLSYHPDEIEMNILDGVSVEIWPIEADSTTYIYFDVAYTEHLDSCD